MPHRPRRFPLGLLLMLSVVLTPLTAAAADQEEIFTVAGLSRDDLWKAALLAVADAGMSIKESDPASGSISAMRVPWGLTVVMTPKGDQFEVNAVSRKVIGAYMTFKKHNLAKEFRKSLLERIEKLPKRPAAS